jgi:hypothetical protein
VRENQEVHPETLVLDAEPDADAVENHADADGVPALKSPFSWNSVHTTCSLKVVAVAGLPPLELM